MEAFTTYYSKLTNVNFNALCSYLVTARIITHEDSHVVLHTVEPSKAASYILEKISASLYGDTDAKFDEFLSILERCNDLFCIELAEKMKKDLLKNTAGIAYSAHNSVWLSLSFTV